MIIEGGKTLTEVEAAERFRLRERLQRYRDGGREPRADVRVCVVEGDHRHAGDLELDFERFDHSALVVDGDLDVDGSVLITTNWGGPFLLVTGSLRAHNVVAGDGEIRIDGDADIAGLLLGVNNDGYLSIGGATRARLVMNDDHAMDIKTASPLWSLRDWPAGMPLSEHLHRDVPVERDDDGVEHADNELLIARMRDGLPVVRDADDDRPRKTYAQWLADCEVFGSALRFVPRELVDAALCEAAVRADGHALRFVPRELVTDALADAALESDPRAIGAVPEEFRTPERCRIAVEHDGYLLHEVPVPLRTPELCARALETDQTIHGASAIPDAVFTPELALHAVQLYAGSLRHVPERLRTRDVCIAALKVNPFLIDEVPEGLRGELKERYRT